MIKVEIEGKRRPAPLAFDASPRFKLVLLGDAGVGKTSLFIRIRDDKFSGGPPNTIGLDSCDISVKMGGMDVKVSLWDTAGVERFRTLTRNFYRNAHGVMLSFNLHDSSTLRNLSKWVDDTARYAPKALRFLIGCKNDLDMAVPRETVENFAKTHGCEYAFVTSAKTGIGIPEALAAIGTRLAAVHGQQRYELESSWIEDNVNINQGNCDFNAPTIHKRSCCS